MTKENWIAVIAIIAPVANSWLLWFITRPQKSPSATPSTNVDKANWLLTQNRWVYLSSAIIICGIVELLFQLFSLDPVTRFSIFIISYLTTTILVQLVLLIIIKLRGEFLIQSHQNRIHALKVASMRG